MGGQGVPVLAGAGAVSCAACPAAAKLQIKIFPFKHKTSRWEVGS